MEYAIDKSGCQLKYSPQCAKNLKYRSIK